MLLVACTSVWMFLSRLLGYNSNMSFSKTLKGSTMISTQDPSLYDFIAHRQLGAATSLSQSTIREYLPSILRLLRDADDSQVC